MDVSWVAIKESALNFEFLVFLSLFGLNIKSYAEMKSVQLGARIALAGLPFGIVCSIAARSLDASGYGISLYPVAVFFICKGIATREGFDPAAIRARRRYILRNFFRFDKW